MIERKAQIFNIQKYNMYDGPGVRTLVFFQGCPLRCEWCSNPEGQLKQFQVLFKKDACINCGACVPVCPTGVHSISADGIHIVDRDVECVGCRRCEEACFQTALAIVGESKTISELVEIIEEDRAFYQTSGGGVTLGGGEVLAQPQAATSLLQACKQCGIDTAIETCGYARPEVIQKVAPFVDTFLYDVKHMDSERHREITGVHNEMILGNLIWLLENRHNVKIRMPLLKGINDGEAEILQLIELLKPYQDHKNFKGVDLLPYHKMGVNKYKQLGWKYPVEGDPKLSDADLERIENFIKKYDFPVSVVRH
ncbi:choline TMA-lyase-activating enzyme [Maridesulfovibrio hydrothermalis]|uniref:Glycyl-radical enzyme activating protein family n=1 Tax=Maridesulfovibrio hydrothermalis AM13 = DSM 14728 TaxID=1121451 RepID=L0RBN1_9BACT|nr:choline TMA-lyase-activating enzyme [Maridesulfovibrio hydrothermalis]CCO23632.1 Glycyl-radical enzyme activating protein family [Maridesulfovibrio hydrothermalis AM13 = DSM 14728]